MASHHGRALSRCDGRAGGGGPLVARWRRGVMAVPGWWWLPTMAGPCRGVMAVPGDSHHGRAELMLLLEGMSAIMVYLVTCFDWSLDVNAARILPNLPLPPHQPLSPHQKNVRPKSH